MPCGATTARWSGDGMAGGWMDEKCLILDPPKMIPWKNWDVVQKKCMSVMIYCLGNLQQMSSPQYAHHI